MIPDYGNPAVDYLIKKLDCEEVIMPTDKKALQDECFKEILSVRKRVIDMLTHIGVVNGSPFPEQVVATYVSIVINRTPQ